MDSVVQSHGSASIALGHESKIPPLAPNEPIVYPDRELLISRQRLLVSPRPKKNTLARLVGFFALVLGLVGALDTAITAGLRRITTSSFGATNRLINGKINADIVITGSSRALVHYDPRVLQAATGMTAYNLGRNGSQTDLQLAVLKTYLNHNTKPRLVVHNLDLFSCVTSHEIYDPTQYVPYLHEDSIYTAVARVYPDAWKWRYAPLYGYVVPDLRFTWLLGIKRLAGFEPPEDTFDGFVPRSLSWSDDFERFRRDHPDGFRTPVESQGVRDLEELITLCRDHGVPLLLVYSPEYSEIQPLERNRREIFALFAHLSDRHGISLWDFSTSEISRHREYFYNSQHLNAEGAALFSAEFGRRLAATGTLAFGRPASDARSTIVPVPSPSR